MTVPYAAVSWRKSTRSSTSGGACVEVKNDLGAFRDSKNADGPALSVPAPAFIRAVKTGRFTR